VEFMQEESAPGLSGSVKRACREAGVNCDGKLYTPDLIIGHGNGVSRSDSVELDAYTSTMAPGTPLASIKAVTGELGEAAGVASCIAALDALLCESVPPTFNFSAKDDLLGSHREITSSISSQAQAIPGVRQALVTQRSFLGISCSLVVSKA
ncbi:MAG: hypothetical protein EBU49_08135, partial [Proteobacteria bacterium]|nr:hypothetical protein [Pseudomonadota bacterium]